MTTTEVIAAVNALILLSSASVAFIVYRWNERQKRKDRALDLFKSLMTSEFLIRARMTSHEYLLEDPRNEKYAKFKGLNFEELDTKLRSNGSQHERGDRFMLRAIPNFFGAVDLAWRHDYLLKQEKIFSEVYAWYWVNIIEERQVPGNPMFSFHAWMTSSEDIEAARQDRTKRLRSLHLDRADT
ncbi:hypothetical protein ABHF54_13110 [Nitrosomonas europaea]|uniref:hypothetical protein n=1 Tax=Nitrosomonas europaea TaxID=915 RepID=UPI003267B438